MWATEAINFESLNQLSATTSGAGSSRPRRPKAATLSSSMPCAQPSLLRQRAPGPVGGGPRQGKCDRPHEGALADDDQQQDAINAVDHALMLPTVPRPNELQVLPVFAKHRVVPYPRPLPATAGGGAPRFDMAPQGTEDIVAKLPQALEPGALGQGGQEPGGHILVPSPRSRQLMGTAAPKEGGKHEAEDFPQELLLGSQAAFDLDDEVIRQAYVVEGLVQGFDI